MLWVVFLLFWTLHLAWQIQNSLISNSNSLEGWAGIRVWLKHSAVIVIIRLAFSILLMGLWFEYPDGITRWTGGQHIPINWITVGVVSFFIDEFLNRAVYSAGAIIPGLKSFKVEIPQLAPPPTPPPANGGTP